MKPNRFPLSFSHQFPLSATWRRRTREASTISPSRSRLPAAAPPPSAGATNSMPAALPARRQAVSRAEPLSPSIEACAASPSRIVDSRSVASRRLRASLPALCARRCRSRSSSSAACAQRRASTTLCQAASPSQRSAMGGRVPPGHARRVPGRTAAAQKKGGRGNTPFFSPRTASSCPRKRHPPAPGVSQTICCRAAKISPSARTYSSPAASQPGSIALAGSGAGTASGAARFSAHPSSRRATSAAWRASCSPHASRRARSTCSRRLPGTAVATSSHPSAEGGMAHSNCPASTRNWGRNALSARPSRILARKTSTLPLASSHTASSPCSLNGIPVRASQAVPEVSRNSDRLAAIIGVGPRQRSSGWRTALRCRASVHGCRAARPCPCGAR